MKINTSIQSEWDEWLLVKHLSKSGYIPFYCYDDHPDAMISSISVKWETTISNYILFFISILDPDHTNVSNQMAIITQVDNHTFYSDCK